MKGYISYLLDYRAKQSKILSLDCKFENVAEHFKDIGDLRPNNKIEIRDIKSFYKDYCPVEKHDQYRFYCIENFIFPLEKPKIDNEYLAAVFDLAGSFKVPRRGDKYYPSVIFRDKNIIESLCCFFKKPTGEELSFSGKELVCVLEEIKPLLLVKRVEADLLCEIAMKSNNQIAYEKWKRHLELKKIQKKIKKQK